MFYKRGFVIDLVLTTMFLPIPLIIFIAACVVHYDILPMYFIIIIASSCFGLFLFVYEQIFIPALKEFNRIRTEARKIIKAHNQQHFKKALRGTYS